MSRFVSGGTNDAPTERDEAWLKAQLEIETKRQQTAEAGKQQDGKSLYETLQANKAAKQEAFEDSIRLRNQFQTLNEDEVEFLDSVLESTRKQDAAVKKQTREDLEEFKRQQEEAEKTAKTAPETTADDDADKTNWVVGRKRKKAKEDLLGGVKLRKGSSSEDKDYGRGEEKKSGQLGKGSPSIAAGSLKPAHPHKTQNESKKEMTKVEPQPKALAAGLGLVAYSSDEGD